MFYINTTTKKFIAGPLASDSDKECCYCCEGTDVPLFLRTKVMNPSLIQKPKLVHYQTTILQFSLRDSQGFPYDLTDKELVLVVDNTFQHSDSLIALSSDFQVLDAQEGLVQFTLKCSSRKFQKMVNNKIPASQVWMQITSYSPQDIEGTVILQDRGITLAPKLYTTEGIPEDNDPNYYNKQQIDAFLIDIGRPDLVPDKGLVVAGEDPYSDSRFYADDLYINPLTKDFYLKLSDSVLYLGSLDKSDYYTKSQVDQIADALSDSIAAVRDSLGNYYTKAQVDGIASYLSNSIAGVKSSLSDYYTIEQADQLLDTKASDSYVQKINQQVQDLKQLHIVKLNTPQQGFAATYQLQDRQGNPLGASINIFKDKFLSDADLIVASQQDHEADPSVIVGDPYLKFVFNTQPAATVYVAVKSLVDVYNAGQGLQLQNNTFSIESDQQQDSMKFLQIGTGTIGLKGITTAVNKALSDARTYTDTELQNYYTKSQVDAIVQGLSDSTDLSNYYTKSQVDAIAGDLSDSIAALKQDLHGSYYNKTQIDELFAQFSDSIDLSSYYTKAEVNTIASALSDSIVSIKISFGNYYTKSQVDQLLQELSNSVDLSNYYTKQEVDSIANSLSDSIAAVKGMLGSYYNKGQVDTLIGELSNSISVKLQNYYTKSQTDAIAGSLSDSIAAIRSSLGNYYTKGEADSITGAISNSLAALKQELHGSYYTSTQVNQIASTLSDSIAAVKSSLGSYYTSTQVEGKLQDYYTKSQVEGFLGSLSDSIQAVKGTFSQYYNKGEVDALVSVLSDSIASLSQQVLLQKSYNNIQNKPSIAGVTLQGDLDWDTLGIHQFLNTSQQFTEIDSDSCLTLYGSTLPVAVLTSKGNIYPIEKGSLEYSSQQDTMKLHIHPYLVYDDEETFSGTWKVYFAAGGGKTGLEIVTLTEPSFIPQDRTIYSYTPSASDSMEFLSGNAAQFSIEINMPSPAVSFAFPSSMVWQGDPPTMAAGSVTTVRVLYDGTSYKASVYPDLSNCMPIDGTISKLNVRYRSNYSGQTNSYFQINDTAYPGLIIGKGGTGHGATSVTIQGLVIDLRAYNFADFGVKYNGNKMNQAGGFCINDSNGDLTVPRFVNSKGMQIITPASLTIAPKDNKVYTHALQQSDSIVIDTSALTSTHQINFELHLTQPSTAVTFTLPSSLIWANGDSFASANTAPAMDTADTLYCIVIRWDGTDLLANLAYSKAIEVSA